MLCSVKKFQFQTLLIMVMKIFLCVFPGYVKFLTDLFDKGIWVDELRFFCYLFKLLLNLLICFTPKTVCFNKKEN